MPWLLIKYRSKKESKFLLQHQAGEPWTPGAWISRNYQMLPCGFDFHLPPWFQGATIQPGALGTSNVLEGGAGPEGGAQVSIRGVTKGVRVLTRWAILLSGSLRPPWGTCAQWLTSICSTGNVLACPSLFPFMLTLVTVFCPFPAFPPGSRGCSSAKCSPLRSAVIPSWQDSAASACDKQRHWKLRC